MKDLILLPEPKTSKDSSSRNPGEIFIDPSDRRFSGQSARRPGLILFLGLIAAAGAYAYFRAPDAPKPDPAAAQAALMEKTQQQITALQTEVRELRAKLDAAETRLSAAAAPPPPPTETKAVAAPPPAPAPVAETPAAKSPPAAAAPVQTVAQTPKTMPGYRLREVSNGVAILETKRGVIAVRAGDILAEAGQVNAIQKRGGRWVVSTESGDIFGEAPARAAAPRRRPPPREMYGYAPERYMPSMFLPF